MSSTKPIDVDAFKILAWLAERIARIEAAMTELEEQRLILVEWADELAEREAAVAAREAALVPRLIATDKGPSQRRHARSTSGS
jgi:hypothetical protein